jgi:multisubunit Na+/H+ antiporter MnhB subunit
MTTIMTRLVVRLLLAPAWVVAAAILVKGYSDTGDGFSAAVVASLGILMQYLAFGTREASHLLPVRYARQLALTGLLTALVVAFYPVLRGEPIMTHSPGPYDHVTHIGSLELLTAVLFDVGVFLLVFGFIVGTVDLLARTANRRTP